MKKISNLPFYLFAFIPPSITIFIYGYLGSFTRFLADDYCSFYYARELGLLGSILYWYQTWSGRYSAFGADWLMANTVGGDNIHLVPPLILLTWLLFFIITIYKLLQEKNNKKRSTWLSLILGTSALFLILILTPNIQQSLFWWNGMRSYTLPLVTLTFAIWVFISIKDKIQTNKQKLLIGLASFFFFFANGGLSETYVASQLIFLFTIYILTLLFKQRSNNKTLRSVLIGGIFGTIISLSIILHSHGNAVRRELMPPAPEVITLSRISIDSFLFFIKEIFQQKEKFLGLLGSTLIALWAGMHSSNSIQIHLWKIVLYFFCGLFMLFATFPPGVYGYVQSPPTRTLIIGIFLFVIFWIYAAFLLGSWIAQHKRISYDKILVIAITAIFILGISSITISKSLYASRYIYIDFAEKWDRVDAKIYEAKAAGAPSITTETMDNWAGLDRPNDNPRWWPTRCYSLYYDFLVMGPPYGN